MTDRSDALDEMIDRLETVISGSPWPRLSRAQFEIARDMRLIARRLREVERALPEKDPFAYLNLERKG